MAIHAVPTISEEIYLQDLSKAVKRMESDDPRKEQAWVKVRQATEGDELQVSQYRAEASELLWRQDGNAMEKRTKGMLEERMFRAYLVLIDAANIFDPHGEPLFEFEEGDDYPKFDGNYSKFQDRWGLLHPEVADAIELAMYETNPQWDVMRALLEAQGED
jgi:hypothetical protein